MKGLTTLIRFAFLAIIFFGHQTAAAAKPSLTSDEVYTLFTQGEATLIQPSLFSGYGAAAKFGFESIEIRQLYEQSRWRELAEKVLNVNFGGDLSWFLLGRAAEELRHFDAATKYYEKSIKNSKRKGITGCIANGCLGFSLPADAESRLKLIREFQAIQTASPQSPSTPN